jgi:hypothetical protein
MLKPVTRCSQTVVLLLGLGGLGCRARTPAITAPFSDDFERAELGPDWHDTGGRWGLEGGKLHGKEAHNRSLWLRRILPDDVVIELDATSHSSDGDLKVELFGDGEGYQSDEDVKKDLIYTSSGYVFIFGGWHNGRSTLVKQNEHQWQFEPGVPTRTAPKVEPGRTYHWTITKQGGNIDWRIDGQPFLKYRDPQPLTGTGHQFFGINNWEAPVDFDNLKIRPAP